MPKKSFSELRSIYRASDGSERDLSRFESRRRRRGSRVVVVLLFLCAFVFGAALTAFFLFRNQDRFTGDGVSLTVAAPEQMRSGDEIRYIIRYANAEPTILGNVELSVRYPDGFTFTDAVPASENAATADRGGTWTIGTLPRGRDGTVEIRGTLIGTLNTQLTLQALLTYKPSNFNAEFQEVASSTTTIANSVLDLAIHGPTVAVPDAEASYTLRVTNTTDEAIAHVEVSFEAPQDFTITSSKPEREGTVARWLFPTLKKGEKKEIVIRGMFAATAEESRVLSVKAGFRNGSQFLLQRAEEMTTTIVKGEVTVGMAVNGSASDTPVSFGDVLQYTINVKNRSKEPVEQLSVEATVDSTVVDWATLKDDKKGSRKGSVLTWTQTQIPELRRLDAGKEVTIAFRLNVIPRKVGHTLADLRVESHAAVTVRKAKNIPTPLVVQSNTVTNAVNTNLTFAAEARYFTDDGSKIGEGPLPPRVGQATSYRVRWTAANTLRDVLSMKVSTVIPSDASYAEAGHVSLGTLLYDPATRTLSWTLSRLATTTPEASADFTVRVTPLEGHVGKVMPLSGLITLEGRDRVTGGLLRVSQTPLDTNLDGDEYGQGRGVVQM